MDVDLSVSVLSVQGGLLGEVVAIWTPTGWMEGCKGGASRCIAPTHLLATSAPGGARIASDRLPREVLPTGVAGVADQLSDTEQAVVPRLTLHQLPSGSPPGCPGSGNPSAGAVPDRPPQRARARPDAVPVGGAEAGRPLALLDQLLKRLLVE